MATLGLIFDQIVELGFGANYLSCRRMICYTISRDRPGADGGKRGYSGRAQAGPIDWPVGLETRLFMSDINKISKLNFCDLMCAHARLPKETALDGSGSCRTFIALYCNLRKSIVPKNMPCSKKKVRTKPPAGPLQAPD